MEGRLPLKNVTEVYGTPKHMRSIDVIVCYRCYSADRLGLLPRWIGFGMLTLPTPLCMLMIADVFLAT